MTNEQANPEQAAYERRMLDLCSIAQLVALTVDPDPESRALTRDERIALAVEYAEAWTKARGFGVSDP
jgi:hypothetical protein